MQVFDPLAEPGKHMVEIIDLSKEREKRKQPPHPQPYPVLLKEWDEGAQQDVDTVILRGDPGDETGN